ncbi:IclR family transcriptional regulator [Halobacillus andaensis]|uniref:IclR family transcriptional regulator n=1 Tax=Halobacillus andaensis TaxID=1176239 RepID=UPI003D73F00E
MTNAKSEQGLRTVQRAIDILNCFSEEQSELSLTEIASEIELAKSTTSRLLSTLEQNSIIEKDQQTLKYKLGMKVYYLGYLAGKSIETRLIAKPIMNEVRDHTKETVNLYSIDDIYRVCLEQAEGLRSVRHSVKIGQKLPLWAGAGGKALLAFQEQKFINELLTIVDKPELDEELRTIRVDRVCCSIDERGEGTSAVAAPIFDINGKVKACLSISGPAMRFSQDKIAEYQQLVKESASVISSKLGYRN